MSNDKLKLFLILAFSFYLIMFACSRVPELIGFQEIGIGVYYIIVASLILMLVFTAILHYNCWALLPEKLQPFSPEKAVGFLFVPFFNLYWMFPSFIYLVNGWNTVAVSKGLAFPNDGLKFSAVLFGIVTILDKIRVFDNIVAATLGFAAWSFYYFSLVKVICLCRKKEYTEPSPAGDAETSAPEE